MPEMARLLEATRVQPLGDSNSVHPHFAVCAICREQFEGLVQTESQVRGMQSSAAELPQGDCPSQDVWGEVARGETEPDQALAWIGHASRCEYCGPRLRSAIGTLVETNAELTESDRKQIASLDSSGAEWQQRLAQRITGDPHSGRERPRWWEAYLAPVVSGPRLAVAMVAILMVAALVGWQVSGERKTAIAANRLLARAYTNQRTLELRIPEAEYAPLRVQRGPAASFVARPPALLKAEALIASQLAAHPDDPAWLQAAARANMLEGKYDAAVESLERALELQPRAPELLADLGTAHFQRGQSEDRQEDFGAAYENFSKVLVLQPENTVVLFNRAIVAEHQFLYRQALDDWEHYLKLDARSQWSEEARNRAEAVRAKLKEHESGAQPLLSPDKIASFANGGADAAKLELEVDQRVEQYLDVAVRSWLALAYPEGGTAADLKARQALFFLADLTLRKHHDRWLTDLLSGSSNPSFPRAVAALGKAFQANRSGNYETARSQSQVAEQLFSGSGNGAGVLRAGFEQILTSQLTRQNGECERGAVATSAEAEQTAYAWLQIQLQLEKAVCSLLEEEDWGADERLSRGAMERARQNNYQELYLRALFFAAEDEVRNGDLRAGLKSVAAGLNSYWSGQLPHIRGYSLYNLEGTVPELVATEPHFVMAVWREGTALVDSDDDLLMRAWAHGFAARAAAAAHEPQSAAAEFAQASELFGRAPRNDASRRFLFQNEILTAQLEAELGQYDSGLERLTRIQNQIRIRPDKFFEELFYATLGELQLRSHNAVQAEQAFQPALELAEQRLQSLNSEAERVKWSKEAAPLYLGMAEAELVQGHSERSLEFFEWYLDAPARSGQNGGFRTQGATPDPKWLASRLPLLSGQTVIAYGTLPDGLAIWEFDNRGVNAQWFPQSNQDLQELAARFYDLASDSKSAVSALRRDSQTLYVALITPVEQRLDPGRTLVIETNGWLTQVPFEALLDSTGHYLIERASIVHSLGQGMDASLHPSVSISSDLHAVVVGSAASSQSEGLIPLPDVAAEADAVARNFRSPAVFKGADATLRTVEKELPSAAVFHYTGHSMARTTGAALMLPGTGSEKGTAAFLDGDRLRHLGLHNLQLAVLSTCNTRFGNDDGRGFNSIAEGLERAGVPHVVASRWPVDSVETRKYVENFYGHALSGELVSEALRETSRSMMADPRTSHPYYWSAFSAYGRP
jgi:CHAT domain-containing protein/cytochrome c-type biogenesis protein CcmH/NrfG